MEKEENVKHLMEVNGLDVKNYWLSSVLFFFIFFMAASMFFFCFGWMIMDDGLFQRVPVWDIVVFIVLWNLNQVLYSIFISGFLNSSGTASAIGFMLSMPINFFSASTNLHVYPFPTRLPIFYKFFPITLLSRVVMFLMLKGNGKITAIEQADHNESLLMLAFNSLLYGALGLVINEPKIRSKFFSLFSKSENDQSPEHLKDTQVKMHESAIAEKEEIYKLQSVDMYKYAAVCKDIKKKFMRNNKCFYALKGVNLRINKGEVFGLLGPNGAGKTTFISILTGFLSKDSGSIFIDGKEVVSTSESSAKVSLCPQFDILWPSLSVYEHLKFFGLFRNIDGEKLERNIEEVINSTNLTKQKDQTVGTLSGGMKRRVSLGISLIGDIEVVFLDEPSTGLDPKKRRNFWNIIDGLLISEQKEENICDQHASHGGSRISLG
jgi:ABC-type glutathione transport system ATPase component